jgi:hypothetical protein
VVAGKWEVGKTLEIIEVELVVALYIIVGIQMAVYSPFSDQIGLMAGCWVRLVLMQHLQPSRNMQVMGSNTGVQSLQGVRQEMGAVKRWLPGTQMCWQLSKIQEGVVSSPCCFFVAVGVCHQGLL